MASPTHPANARVHALEYQYRDAGNWKTHGIVLLKGACAPQLHAGIVDALDAGLYFIAEQVGLPALQRRHNDAYGSASANLDHAFHEFIDLRPATAEDLQHQSPSLPLDHVAKLFARAKRRGWDCGFSPYG